MNLKLQFSLLLSSIVCLIPNPLKISSAVARDITSDGTTGTTVTNDGNNYTIQDGTRNGGNLFHSFQDFSVPTGGSASFNNGNDISNILSRVTGGNISNIDGLIRANGGANLFLINPAGIIFGEGASLAIGGSFYGSTADSILFDGGEFSAVNNLDTPILTINAPIGLNFRDNPSDIVNNSVANDGIGLTVLPETNLALVGGNITFNSGIINAPGANVQFASLASGGNVTIDENLNLTLAENITKADILFSEGSTVDVASDGGGSITIEARNVDLNQGSQLIGGIDEDLGVTNSQAGDITLNVSDAINLSGESFIDNEVNSGTEGNSGDINIVAGSLELIEGSTIGTTTFGQGNAGNVSINVSDTIAVDGEDPSNAETVGGIFSTVQGEAVGNAGGVEITTTNLNLTNGGTVSASTFATGNAGTVTINANDTISLDGVDNEGFSSGIDSSVNSGGIGDAGGVEITTANLNLANGGTVSASTFAQGNAGTVSINASNDITVDGEDPGNVQTVGGIFSSVVGEAVGDAGGVEITTANLNLTNGGVVSSSTFAQGNAGTITIDAVDTISIDGIDQEGFNSGIASSVSPGAVGNAGGVEITTTNLNLTNGGTVSASTFAQGNAGTITIDASDNISIDGEDPSDDVTNGGIFSNVQGEALGDAGGVEITTANLNLTNGGIVAASTFAQGNAGTVTINATDSISIDGIDQEGVESSIESNVNANAIGNAGGVNISTNELSISNGATVSATTFGEGNAGTVTINATDTISIDGEEPGAAISVGGIFSTVQGAAVGNAGGIEITTANINLTNGATISASTFAQGNAGTVNIDAVDTISIDGIDQEGFNSGIASSVSPGAVGDAGGVEIMTTNLDLTNGGSISTITFAEGDAGTININATDTISIDGDEPSDDVTNGGIFSNVQGEAVGDAGGVEITTANLNLANGGIVAASTFARGNAGTVTINASDSISVDGIDQEGFESSIESNVNFGAVGNAGGVNLSTNELSISNGATVSASTFGEGNAGTISINATDSISIDGENLEGFFTGIDGSVNAGAIGDADGINITTANLDLTNGGTISASTFGAGNAGSISINASNDITVDGEDPGDAQTVGGIFSSVVGEAVGDAGGVEIITANLNLANGGTVSASTFAQGNAGTVTINASDTISIDGIDQEGFNSGIASSVSPGAVGNAGGVEITATNLNLTNGGTVSASTFAQGNAGTVTINASDTISIDGEEPGNATSVGGIFSTVEEEAVGDAGGIEINTANLNLTNGGVVSASTFGQGNAGTVTIDAVDTISIDGIDQEGFNSGIASSVSPGAVGNAGGVEITTTNLNLTNGGTVSATTFAQGNAGTITINASDTISIDGDEPSDDVTNGGIFSNVQGEAVGNAGGVEITTANLNLTNGGIVAASTFAQGNAGTVIIDASNSIAIDGIDQEGVVSSIESNINAGAVGDTGGVDITTPNLVIENGAGIFANAFGEGDGGNITLNISDRLTLQENSTISVQASETDASGGDITINAEDGFVIAFPNETDGNGSDIAAFSSAGAGGNITIEAQGVLGLEERTAVPGNNTNDIDASGEIEDGSVEIITPSSDGIQAANQLPSIPVQPTDAVVQACSAQREIANNSFVIKGKGGIPNEPSAMLSSEIITINGDETSSQSPGRENIQPIATSKGDIIPARGVEITENGRIILTAYETNIASRKLTTSTNCN